MYYVALPLKKYKINDFLTQKTRKATYCINFASYRCLSKNTQATLIMRHNIFILFIFLFLSSCANDENESFNPPELPVDEQLTSQIWKVNYFNDGSQNQGDFDNSYIEFNTDNTFDLLDKNNNIYSGKWAIDGSLLVIQSDGLITGPKNSIEGEWLITQSFDNIIQIKERDGTDEFSFAKPDQQQLPSICNDTDALITGQNWVVKKFTKNGSNILSENIVFDFSKDNSFETTNGAKGVWTNGIRCSKLQLDFGTANSELTKPWNIQYLSENNIKLKYVTNRLDWSLELAKNIGTDTLEFAQNSCSEINQVLDSSQWVLSTVKIGNQINTAKYAAYTYTFNRNNTMSALAANEKIVGSWGLSNDCDNIQITFSDNATAEILNGNWRLFFVSERKLKLLSTVDNTLKEIHFSK